MLDAETPHQVAILGHAVSSRTTEAHTPNFSFFIDGVHDESEFTGLSIFP